MGSPIIQTHFELDRLGNDRLHKGEIERCSYGPKCLCGCHSIPDDRGRYVDVTEPVRP